MFCSITPIYLLITSTLLYEIRLMYDYMIPKKINAVNENLANVFSLEVKDRALQGCNLSVTSSPRGKHISFFYVW
jgi:hypothetical protein